MLSVRKTPPEVGGDQGRWQETQKGRKGPEEDEGRTLGLRGAGPAVEGGRPSGVPRGPIGVPRALPGVQRRPVS